MFTYITGNPNKIASAKKILGENNISFRHMKLDIDEIQSRDPKKIAIRKANEAYRLINAPVLINDASWSITSLNGFPGAYMHDVHDWLKVDDFLRLMKGISNREIVLTTQLTYKDAKTEMVFENKTKGYILENPEGIGRIEIDRIITLRKDKKSIAFCVDNELPTTDNKKLVWKDFVSWYKARF